MVVRFYTLPGLEVSIISVYMHRVEISESREINFFDEPEKCDAQTRSKRVSIDYTYKLEPTYNAYVR